jgi:hypothetical protein
MLHWFVTGSVNTLLMDGLDCIVLESGHKGLETLALWMYFSGVTLHPKFVSEIQNTHHPIKYTCENFAVMDNVVSVLTYVQVKFRHFNEKCLQKSNGISRL